MTTVQSPFLTTTIIEGQMRQRIARLMEIGEHELANGLRSYLWRCHAVCYAHDNGILSEGQASHVLVVDRLTYRAMREAVRLDLRYESMAWTPEASR